MTTTTELHTGMTIQPGVDVLRLVTRQGTVTITRAQADDLLASRGMLVIDPLTRMASVRPYFDDEAD